MATGMVLHVVSYIARVQSDPLVYRIATTISPAFFSAAIHYSLFRVREAYGWGDIEADEMRFKVLDVVALVMQVVGGFIAFGQDVDIGMSFMRAGLVWWLVSILVIVGCAGRSAWTRWGRRAPCDRGEESWDSRKCGRFHGGKSLAFRMKTDTNNVSSRRCHSVHLHTNSSLFIRHQ
jgi:hypothetical protein